MNNCSSSSIITPEALLAEKQQQQKEKQASGKALLRRRRPRRRNPNRPRQPVSSGIVVQKPSITLSNVTFGNISGPFSIGGGEVKK